MKIGSSILILSLLALSTSSVIADEITCRHRDGAKGYISNLQIDTVHAIVHHVDIMGSPTNEKWELIDARKYNTTKHEYQFNRYNRSAVKGVIKSYKLFKTYSGEWFLIGSDIISVNGAPVLNSISTAETYFCTDQKE